jgi:hypothetical protein
MIRKETKYMCKDAKRIYRKCKPNMQKEIISFMDELNSTLNIPKEKIMIQNEKMDWKK